MASVGPSIQLAMGRLQLQEQRINTLVRRGDVVRDALTAAHKRAAELRDRFGNLQRALEESTEPLHRSNIEGELPIIKQDLARATAEIQRLQTEESEAAAQVSSEQTRWAEINQRLEELDRALARRDRGGGCWSLSWKPDNSEGDSGTQQGLAASNARRLFSEKHAT